MMGSLMCGTTRASLYKDSHPPTRQRKHVENLAKLEKKKKNSKNHQLPQNTEPRSFQAASVTIMLTGNVEKPAKTTCHLKPV